MKILNVSIGIIFNEKNEILVALRAANADWGGYWEFPGGKIEEGETSEKALIRELFEELDIEVITLSPFLVVEHDYQKHKILLHVFKVIDFLRQPIGKEGQELRWVMLDELPSLKFPSGNQIILQALETC
ncbi:MAG: 8-oxo-dGTP diphosphatase [Legionellaceae bacterium]